MGRDNNFTCCTCKKTYYLGYSTYSGWLDNVNSLKEFDESDSDNKELTVNQRIRQCLVEHDGHDFLFWSGDWCSEREGNLYIDGCGGFSDKLFCEGIGDYEHIDLDK